MVQISTYECDICRITRVEVYNTVPVKLWHTMGWVMYDFRGAGAGVHVKGELCSVIHICPGCRPKVKRAIERLIEEGNSV